MPAVGQTGGGAAETSVEQALPEEAARLFRWRSIGPANMGGRITSLAVYEADPNTWWAATASGGLLKTTNNGITFEHQFDRQATVSIGDVQVCQSDPNIVWVGTGEANPRNSVSWGDGVYKSTDGGKTWKNMGLRKIFQTGRIAIHPTNPDIVFVGALGRLWGSNPERGLYKTTDGGKSWKRVLFVDEQTGVIDVQINPADPSIVLAATYVRRRDGFDGNDPEVKFGEGAGIYRSTDGGETFSRMTAGLPRVKMGRIGLSFFRQDPQHVYAIIETEKIGQMPEDFPFVGFSGESVEAGARITAVTKDSSAEKAGLQVGDIVISVDGQRVLNYDDLLREVRKKSAGAQASWEIVRDGKVMTLELTYGRRAEPPAEEQEDAPSRRRSRRSPFSASLGGQLENLQGQQGPHEEDFGGVYHSADGGVTWRRINSVNPRPMYYSQIRVDPSDRNYIYVLGTSLYRSSDGGQRFTDDGANNEVHVDHHALWIDPRDGRHMILGNDGGIYVTNDRMKKWDHLNHVAIGQFYHIGISQAFDYQVYGGMQDNGSWGGPTRVPGDAGPRNTDWYRVGSGDGFVTLVDPQDPHQIYFESQNGGMGRIHLQTGERAFVRPRPPRGVEYRFNWKTPFILSPHNSQIHYSAGNYVFKSVSKGDNPAPISPEITNTDKGAGSALAESPRKAGVLYVGTTDGAVWVALDDGKSWYNLFRSEDVQHLKEALAPPRNPSASDEAEDPAATRVPESRSAAGRPPGGRGRGRGEGMNPQRMLQMLRQRDANGDGFVEASELPPPMTRILERLDRDGDGKLSMQELEPAAASGSGSPRNRPSTEASSTAATQQSPSGVRIPPPVIQPPRLGQAARAKPAVSSQPPATGRAESTSSSS
ncbi:MAG: PDZ domain-containing protein, partial [Planctomycetota bacterium]